MTITKTGTVGDIPFAAHLMLKRMTVPITVATELRVPIDGVTAKEHQRATRFVVIWRIENHRTELDRSLKAGFAKVIGKIIIRVCAEIILAKDEK